MACITFVYPRKTLPLSLTGNACVLDCPHCRGHYLEHMKDVSQYLEEETKPDVTSVLVSGGCDTHGAVPLGKHIDLLKQLSEDYRVIAHTGLIKEENIALVSPYISAASFNFIGNNDTIKEMYNLDKTTQDFMDSYQALSKEVSTFPHITIGLHHGKVKGEYNAIDMISQLKPDALVFNVIISTPGTEFENVEPPSVEDVMAVISYARHKSNKTPIYLGCMRPGGLYREKLDVQCLEAGVERIVMPSQKLKQLAQSSGYKIIESEECCII